MCEEVPLLRFVRLLPIALLMLLVSGCYGEMRPATNVGSTSANLHAIGRTSCGKGILTHFEYSTSLEVLKAGGAIRTAERTISETGGACNESPTNAPISAVANGLMPGLKYYARICGRDIGNAKDVCSLPIEFSTPFDNKTISDTKFARGFDVLKNCDGRDNRWPVEYKFQPGNAAALGVPVWMLGQHFSFYNIAGDPTVPTTGSSAGMWTWSNPGKTVSIRKATGAAWDLITEVNTINEYRWNTYHIYPQYVTNPASGYYECDQTFPGFVKDPGAIRYRFKDYRKWVHLLTAYKPDHVTLSKPISKLASLDFDLTARLLKNKIVRSNAFAVNPNTLKVDSGKKFDAQKDIIHYVGIVHVQNRNYFSPSFMTHRVALMMNIYHSEFALPPGHGPMLDPVTQTVMVGVPYTALSPTSLWNGGVTRLHANLLPFAKSAVRQAFPADSIDDYVVTGMLMSFEANGVGDVSLAVRNLKLEGS